MNMKKIVLTCSRYEGKPCIFLKFEYDDELISIVKKLDGAFWSGRLRVWHIKDSAENMKLIEQLFHGIAEIEFFGIKKDRMNERLTPVKISEDTEIGKSLRRFNEYLTQKRYSKNTIKVYNESLGIFLAWVLKDERKITIENIDSTLKKIWSIGGETGWYYANFLWQIRGIWDKIQGGVGLRRGRKNQFEIEAGESLDFWRVLYANKDEMRFLLYAEMKLPGEAWLEFKIDNENILNQTATFRPLGLWGRIYWYSLLPFHAIIFKGMMKRLAN